MIALETNRLAKKKNMMAYVASQWQANHFKNQLVLGPNGQQAVISAEKFGQVSTIKIPDPGTASTNFVLTDSKSGVQTIHGKLIIDGEPVIDGNLVVNGTITSLATQEQLHLGPEGKQAILNADGLGQDSTYALPDPGKSSTSILVADVKTGPQTMNSSLVLAGNLIMSNTADRSIIHGLAATNATRTLTIQGSANSTAGDGGIVAIVAGESVGGAAGGEVTVTGGVGGDTGGSVNLVGGKGNTGNGGNIYLQGGMAENGTGGNLFLYCGESNGTNKSAGSITMSAGNGTDTADGGFIEIAAGPSQFGTGGTVSITSGSGLDTGNIDIATTGASNGASGNITIQVGEAGGPADQSGGMILIAAGKGNLNGPGGDVLITSGSSDTGSSGAVSLDVGFPEDTGQINIGFNSVPSKISIGNESMTGKVEVGTNLALVNAGTMLQLTGGTATDFIGFQDFAGVNNVTVANTKITAQDIIVLTAEDTGTPALIFPTYHINAGVSFVITTRNSAGAATNYTGRVNYFIVRRL